MEVRPPRFDVAIPSHRRVATGLALLGAITLVDLLVGLGDAFRNEGQVNLLSPFGAIGVWVLAWLVWRGNKPVWAVLAYGSATSLAVLAGGIVGALLGMPPRLLVALGTHGPFNASPGLTFLFLLVFAAAFCWLLWETQRTKPLWAPSVRLPASRWVQPGAFLLYLAPLAGLGTLGILNLIQGEWTRPVITRAQAQHGERFDYFVQSYHVQRQAGKTRHQATVIGYSPDEVRHFRLDWEN